MNNNNDDSLSSSWISLRDSWNSLADDEDLQAYMDALEHEQQHDDSVASFSSPLQETSPMRQQGGGVCFSDTVQEVSPSGEITQSPLKYSSSLVSQEERGNTLQTLLASLPVLESNDNHHDSGSLQSLNLLEDVDNTTTTDVDATLYTSTVREMIQDAIHQAWSEDDEDDDNHHLQNMEHSTSQRHTVTMLARARHPNLTVQYVSQNNRFFVGYLFEIFIS